MADPLSGMKASFINNSNNEEQHITAALDKTVDMSVRSSSHDESVEIVEIAEEKA